MKLQASERAEISYMAHDQKLEKIHPYIERLKRKPTDLTAIQALEEFLSDAQHREVAARALVTAYKVSRKYRKQLAALDVIVEVSTDAQERLSALRQSAVIHSKHLQQPEQAFAALASAVRIAPGDSELRSATRIAAQNADTIDTYAEILEEILETDNRLDATPLLHLELADLYEKKLDDPINAIQHLRSVLELDTKQIDALNALRRLHRVREEWSELVPIIAQLASLAAKVEARAALDREAAILSEQQLDDLEGAARYWRNVLECDAMHSEAASMLDRLYGDLDLPEEQANILALRCKEERKSSEIAFRLAALKQNRLNDLKGALEVYRQILGKEPTHSGTLAEMENWAKSDDPYNVTAAEILDPILAQTGAHSKRIAIREVRIAQAKSVAEKARLTQEIRSILERDLGQKDAAFINALKAFTDGLEREEIQGELERLAHATGSLEELAAIYESTAVQLPEDDQQLIPLLRKSAEFYEQLDELEDATRVWNLLLDRTPKDPQVLKKLAILYEKSSNAGGLSDVYMRQAELAKDSSQRFELLLKATEAHISAGDDAAAIESIKLAQQIRNTQQVLITLEQLYDRTYHLNEQLDVLEQLMRVATQPAEKLNYLLKRASLLEEQERDSEGIAAWSMALKLSRNAPAAIAGLERLLTHETLRVEAATLLEPVYRELSDSKKLLDVLDIKLSTLSPAHCVPVLMEIADLHEEIGQKAMALPVRIRAFSEEPSDTKAREALERLCVELHAFEELAALYEDTLERELPEPLAGELWRRLAIVYRDHLSRSDDDAAGAWNEVLKRHPKDMVALDALEAIYNETNQFQALAHVIERKLALETDATAQLNLLFALANIAEDMLSDRNMAADCYQKILEKTPENRNVIQFLTRILEETERWAELAELLEHDIQLAEVQQLEAEVLEIMVRLGRLKATRLADPKSALSIFREILHRKPAHVGAIEALEEFTLTDNPHQGEAAAVLEPIFARQGEHEKVVQMLELRVADEPLAAERSALLRKISEVYIQQFENSEMAFLAASRAMREFPDAPKNLELVHRLSVALDAEDELIALLDDVAPKISKDELRANVYRVLGRLQGMADAEEEAIDAWRQVLEVTPADMEAFDRLSTLLARQERFQEQFEVLNRQLTITKGTEGRVELLFQMGVLQEEQLQEPENALKSFRQLLKLQPEHLAALLRIADLCEVQGHWTELADILSLQLELVSSDEQPSVTFRLAVLRETQLDDQAGAIDLYAELLSRDPNHADALARMEALYELDQRNQSVAKILDGVFRAQQDTQKLIQLFEARVAVSNDPNERKAILSELATLREEREEHELAALAWCCAFKEDPNDAELRRKLIAANSTAETWDELAQILENELPKVARKRDIAEIQMELAQIYDEQIAEKDTAALWYEKARQTLPEVAFKCLSTLERLYEELGQSTRQADTLDALVKASTNASDQVAALLRLGQLCIETLDDLERAVQAFEQVLVSVPNHLASLQSLEVLYAQAGENDKLFKVLESQRKCLQGAELDRVLVKMADLSSRDPAGIDVAIELYRELLDRNPRSNEAFEPLATLLDDFDRVEELKVLLLRRLQFSVESDEIVQLNHRLGQLLFRRLNHLDEAVPYFRAVIERDAQHIDSLEALRDIFEETHKTDDLVMVLRRLVSLQDDVRSIKEIRIRLAEIMVETNRHEEALDAVRSAFDVDPHSVPELQRLCAVFTHLQMWPDAAHVLEAKSQVEVNQAELETAVQTMFQVADLWRDSADKPDLAARAAVRALDIIPSHRQAHEKALTLYSQLEDWRAYVQVLDRYMPYFTSNEEKVQALCELGRLHETKLAGKDVAFLQYCRALQLMPEDDAIREQVERLADEMGSYDELAGVYEEIADAVPRGPLAERFYLTLARIQDVELNDVDAAEASLCKIFEFDLKNLTALELLSSMFARRGLTEKYIGSLEQQLKAINNPEKCRDVLREIARVYHEQLNKINEAENALLRALDLGPDSKTVDTLLALQRGQQNYSAVVSTLMRVRDIATSAEDRSRLQMQVAQVYEDDLGQDDAAAEAYQLALEFDPVSLQALEALERLFSKLERFSELLEVHERQLELVQDYRERIRILSSSATILESKQQDFSSAQACVEAILQSDSKNLQAFVTLERLLRAQERWTELINAFNAHIQLLVNPEEKAQFYVEIGDIFHQKLMAVDRAVAAYHEAIELEPRSLAALNALGVLYERSGNWPFALEMLEREIQLHGASIQAAELWFRMAKINEDMLADIGNAKHCYKEALRIHPSYIAAIATLKDIYKRERDDDNYEKILLEEIRQTEEPLVRANALVELGSFYSTLGRRDEAAARYEEALEFIPDHLHAVSCLADLYMAMEQWDRCEHMLDIATEKLLQQHAASPNDNDLLKELCHRSYSLGYVSEKNGHVDKALSQYEKACQLDNTYLAALEGYGNLLAKAKRFTEAIQVYQSILQHHRNALTDVEVVEFYWTLGDIHIQHKEFDRAESYFKKALAIDSSHEFSLCSLLSIAEAQKQWKRVGELRQKLLTVLDGDAKFEAGMALGKLAREKLGDPNLAIDGYVAAHRLQVHNLEIMDALCALYRQTKQSIKVAETLEKMLETPSLKSDVERAKRIWFALAETARDELRDIEKATACFNAVLDLDWHSIEAFSAIERMLGKSKKWKTLDDNYKRMLARLPKTEETHTARMTLWKALGDMHLNVLKNPTAAQEAYRVVALGQPNNFEVQELYAELLQSQAGAEQEAVDTWRRALVFTPDPGKAIAQIAELAARRKEYDLAWLAAQVSSGLLDYLSAGEKEILSKLTPYAKKREVAQHPLADRLWNEYLLHPNVRRPLAELLAFLCAEVGGVYKEEFAHYGVNPRKHRIDIPNAQEYQMRHYRYVSWLFGLEHIALFSPFLTATRAQAAKQGSEIQADPKVVLEICHTDPISLKLGGKFFRGTESNEALYMLGRTMAFLRPELLLTHCFSADRLAAVVQAAISLSVDHFHFTAGLHAIDRERELLEKHLTNHARDKLARIVYAYVQRAKPDDLRNYIDGSELSAMRAGAFVAGELKSVKKMIMDESAQKYQGSRRSKLRDLMIFALGDNLHALRVAVGTSVEVQ